MQINLWGGLPVVFSQWNVKLQARFNKLLIQGKSVRHIRLPPRKRNTKPVWSLCCVTLCITGADLKLKYACTHPLTHAHNLHTHPQMTDFGISSALSLFFSSSASITSSRLFSEISHRLCKKKEQCLFLRERTDCYGNAFEAEQLKSLRHSFRDLLQTVNNSA